MDSADCEWFRLIRSIVKGCKETLVWGLTAADSYFIAAVIVFFKELLDLSISSKHIFWSSQQSVTRISGPTMWKNKQQMRASPESSLWRKRSFCSLLSAEPRPHTALFSCTMVLGLLVIWLHAWAVLLTMPRNDYFVAGVVLGSISFLRQIEEAKSVFLLKKSNFATSFFLFMQVL